jgi:hypothetical protein
MATKGKRVVTDDQYRTVDRRMRDILRQLDQKGGSPLDPAYVAQVMQWVSEGRDLIPTAIFHEVLDDAALSAASLLRLVEEKAELTRRDDRLINMIEGPCGGTFELAFHCFERQVATDDVCAFFRANGFLGNNRQFLSWLASWKPRGVYATVPDDSRWVLCFNHDDGIRELRLVAVSQLADNCIIVAFRRWAE